MERKSLVKRSIFVYPVPLVDTSNSKCGDDLSKNKLKTASTTKLPKCKSLGVEEISRSNRNSHEVIPRYGDKKWTYPLQRQRLCRLKVGPMPTPKVQGEWIDLFLDTVEGIEPDYFLKKSLKQTQISIKNIIKALPRKSDFTIRREKNKRFKEVSENLQY